MHKEFKCPLCSLTLEHLSSEEGYLLLNCIGRNKNGCGFGHICYDESTKESKSYHIKQGDILIAGSIRKNFHTYSNPNKTLFRINNDKFLWMDYINLPFNPELIKPTLFSLLNKAEMMLFFS